MDITQEDKERIQYLYHSRPHTKEQGEEIVALYRKYINPGDTATCSKCGGSLFTYLKKLIAKANINTHKGGSK